MVIDTCDLIKVDKQGSELSIIHDTATPVY
jgi:hypothetical protein